MPVGPANANRDTPRPGPLSDSPWFWVLLFSLFGLLALVAISSKYGRRQAGIERKYQARQRLDRGETKATASREFADESSNLIPLWPIALVLLAIAAFSGWKLFAARGLPAQSRGHPTSTPPDP